MLVPALAISTARSAATAIPGQAVSFTVTVTNTVQTAYTGATVNVALASAVDDATYTGASASASDGTVSLNPATAMISWTGNLAGASSTITVTGLVQNPDPGDRNIMAVAGSAAAGSTYPVGSSNPACSATIQVLIPALTVSKTADTASTTRVGRPHRLADRRTG